jgi:DNA-binding transcriptional MerR regulator
LAKTPLPPNEILELAEVARQFGVCKLTLRHWIARRQFPPGKRIGRRRYWRRQDIDRLLDTQEGGKRA